MNNGEEEEICTPPELRASANKAKNKTLPEKSSKRYEQIYQQYSDWKLENRASFTSQNILLAYFSNLSTKKSPNTLWSVWSMLKSMIKLREDVDIKPFTEVTAFIKNNFKGYQPKKAYVFSAKQLDDFVRDAPNNNFLVHKVVLIFGLNGAMRMGEMYNLQLKDISVSNDNESNQPMYIVRIRAETTKTNLERIFTISHDTRQDYFNLVQQYLLLRADTDIGQLATSRLFLHYRNARCVNQIIGINTLRKFPKDIAEHLKLPNATKYTGHSLRRTSATNIANNGADMITLKRLGGWLSDTSAQGYIDHSTYSRKKTERVLHGCSSRPLIQNNSSSLVNCTSSFDPAASFRVEPKNQEENNTGTLTTNEPLITSSSITTPNPFPFDDNLNREFDQPLHIESRRQTELTTSTEILQPVQLNDDYLVEEFETPFNPAPVSRSHSMTVDRVGSNTISNNLPSPLDSYIIEEEIEEDNYNPARLFENCSFVNCSVTINITKK